ncbi:hypothetical protein SSX86_027103 [Deinandra increscens subsp. villosa]|uniref:Eukaryotic translation initiation factor 5B n=1 Tax=Deinandra increscens subsp. villosa TaxID=3103831 RepID=A0AAP0CH72_9ASTR
MMLQMTQEFDLDDTRSFRLQVGPSIASSPPGVWPQFGSPIEHNPLQSVSKSPVLGSVSPTFGNGVPGLASILHPQPARIAPIGKDHGRTNRNHIDQNATFQHSHSLPDSILSQLNEPLSSFGGSSSTGSGIETLSGTQFLWGSPSTSILNDPPKGPSHGFRSPTMGHPFTTPKGPPGITHGFPITGRHGSLLHQHHHVGSAPSGIPFEGHFGHYHESPEALFMSSPAYGGVGIGGHIDRGFLGSRGSVGNGSPSFSSMSSPRVSPMFLGSGPYAGLGATIAESMSDRGRSRRADQNGNQTDSKKQFQLDLDKITSREDTRTTLMIKNIPNKYTSKMLLAAIDENHSGTYDFLYLPIDFKNKCNVGYAFINMLSPTHIIPFYQAFNGKKWEKFNSEKVASLAYARIQGKTALVTHFQNSSLMNEDKRCRPILFHSEGSEVVDQEPLSSNLNIQMHRSNGSDSGDSSGSPPKDGAGPGFSCFRGTSVSCRKSHLQNPEAREEDNVVGVAKSRMEDKEGEKTLRSPICCIMGHVDTGKTKLLDCIRRTNVQEGEAGGITQQIGATYIPAENIRERTKELKADALLNVPGLLVIDTPGHESFKNLRSRGSGLCDIGILVVDIMHGLEPQTIESLNLLRMRNTEFIVALNKVDRLYGWKACRNAPIGKAMKQQSKGVKLEFDHRLTQIIAQFKEQGLNTELYSKNKERGETYSIVPTSAISGEGIPEMILLLVQWAQKTMIEKLTYSNEIQCTVLEVKVIEGLGATIDVVLVNGVLHEGDEIVVCGFQGPIHTTIRSLLTPHPMKELRVKGAYIHHKEIKAAQGIKITAQNLEHAVAGTALYVVGPGDDVKELKESVMDDMRNVMSRVDKSGEGVFVQASTLGSLEALLEFLKTPAVSIPVNGIGIGPVHKKDILKAGTMKKKEYKTILAFDVKVTPEAQEHADNNGVTIFIAHIIYHLFDQFKAYIDKLKEEKMKEAAKDAVFPCVLKIMPNLVFNKKNPIILGVDVIEGILKTGTPICIFQREIIDIGQISSIENNKKRVNCAKKGQKVSIKITGRNAEEQQKMFGRHFDKEDELVSHVSRDSYDVLKANYWDELTNEERTLADRLKRHFSKYEMC